MHRIEDIHRASYIQVLHDAAETGSVQELLGLFAKEQQEYQK